MEGQILKFLTPDLKILKNRIYHGNRTYKFSQAFDMLQRSILGPILPDFARFCPIFSDFLDLLNILICNIEQMVNIDGLRFNFMSDFVRFCPILTNY